MRQYPHISREVAPITHPDNLRPSLIDDLTAFTARLDGLREDQSPKYLSDALRIAFQERELYDLYACSLVGDTKRATELLEVFDKVCCVKYTFPRVGSRR